MAKVLNQDDLLYAAAQAKRMQNTEDNTLANRLKLVIKTYGGTQTVFAQRVGLAQSSVACWMMRDSLSNRTIEKIVKACEGLNSVWLIDGTGDMLTSFHIPDDITRGETYEDIEKLEARKEEHAASDSSQPSIKGDEFVRVDGFSFTPTITNGDIIGISPLRSFDDIDPEKIYYIIKRGGQKLLRHLQSKLEGEDFLLASTENSNLRASQIKLDDIESIHVVETLIRSL